MNPRPDVPEQAIQAFEKIHGLRVTIHDLSGSLAGAMDPSRGMHCHPLCRCVKAGKSEWKCAEFEVLRLRPELCHYPQGRYHVCHAGFVEWVLPVYHQLEFSWVLFAGVRTPGSSLVGIHRERLTRWPRSPWNPGVAQPAPVNAAEADLILEHLRQVAARLSSWIRQEPSTAAISPPSQPFHQADLTQKRTFIHRFIESRHRGPLKLKDLADRLAVTEDRATHLVRECCGDSFRNILVEARLKTARELIRFSSLPILEVALGSGFNEITHFNRLFRKRTGMTPRQFRASFLKT